MTGVTQEIAELRELKEIEKLMEEMAGKPEERHIRQPGERQAREPKC